MECLAMSSFFQLRVSSPTGRSPAATTGALPIDSHDQSHRCSMNDAAGPPKTSANFVALTPLYFLERAAEVFPDRRGAFSAREGSGENSAPQNR